MYSIWAHIILQFVIVFALLIGKAGTIPEKLPIITIVLLSDYLSIILTHKHRPPFYQLFFKYVLSANINAIILQSILFTIVYRLFFTEYWITGIVSILICNLVETGVTYIMLLKSSNKATTQVCNPVILNNGLNNVRNDIRHIPSIMKGYCDDLFYSSVETNGLKFADEEMLVESKSMNMCDCLIDVDRMLILNKKIVNEWCNINQTLELCYKYLDNGGLLILTYIEQTAIEKELNGIVAKMHYILIDRIVPKLPYIKDVYFTIHHGKRKALSRAEMWGRLSYAGFDVIYEKTLENKTNIVTRKIFGNINNITPSYYPVIKLKRVGFAGKIIDIYKLRSMHPYSEFIQKKIFEMNSLTGSGKFQNDFRISEIGKFIRKYWLDELPQLLNLLRGDIKLVGIRAMSQHYFSLYPQEYQNMYLQVKPGLVSPIFDEKKSTFDDIVRIEGDYLRKYLKNSFQTDIEYFFKTMTNIVLGVRSS